VIVSLFGYDEPPRLRSLSYILFRLFLYLLCVSLGASNMNLDPFKKLVDDLGRVVAGVCVLVGFMMFFSWCTSCTKKDETRLETCTAEKSALATCQGDLVTERKKRTEAINEAVKKARAEEQGLCQQRINDLTSGAEQLQCELCCTFSLLPANGGKSCE
jgi:hypothetical protein